MGADIPTPVPCVIGHGGRGTQNSKAFGLSLLAGKGSFSEGRRRSISRAGEHLDLERGDLGRAYLVSKSGIKGVSLIHCEVNMI